MKIILSWVVTTIVICAAFFLAKMPLTAVVHSGALVLVMGPQLVFLIFEYGPNIAGFFSRLSQNGVTEADRNNLAKAIQLGLMFSAFGFLLGIIQILRNADSLSTMGPGISLSLMSVLYAAISPILFIKFLVKEQIEPIAYKIGIYIVMTATALLALTFFAFHTLK